MKNRTRSLLASAPIVLAGLTLLSISSRTTPTKPVANPSAVKINYARLPLSFEPNAGQADQRVKYLARGAGYTIFLTQDETVLSLKDQQHGNAIVRLKLDSANTAATIAPIDQLPGKSNYFIGNDPKQWHTDVPLFSKVRYRDVYPGVDVVYHGNQRRLEYDFVLAPKADPNAIKLNFSGAEKIDINSDGDVVLHVDGGDVALQKPIAYQQIKGKRRDVSVKYVLNGKSQAGLNLGQYDTREQLIIDPVFLYSTYVGGNGADGANAIAVDALGNAYITGSTNSSNFPVTPGAPQGSQPSDPMLGNPSAFVTKLNPTGDTIVYSTYLGGSCTDIGYGIAVDAAGEAYVVGHTGSGFNVQFNTPDCGPLAQPFQQFPQVNPVQPTYGGFTDAFVTKLNAAGNMILYSTFLGGNSSEFGRAIAVDALGNAYVTGDTISPNFPTTANAYQTTAQGGEDAFVAEISFNGVSTSLVYSTYLGGGGLDSGRGITVDPLGMIYVTGTTGSGAINDSCAFSVANPPFPTTPGSYQPNIAPSQSFACMCCNTNIQYNPNVSDAFISKLNPNAAGPASLVYSTYFGGGTYPSTVNDGGFDEGHAIALDAAGNVYITGVAGSATSSPSQPTDFPTKNAFQNTWNGGNAPPGDGFIAKLQLNGGGASDLIYSSYLGNSGSYTEGNGIVVDALNNAYVGGTGPGTPLSAIPTPTPPPCPMCPPNAGNGYGAFYAKIDSVPTLQGMFVIPAAQAGRGIGLDPLAHIYLAGDALSGLTTVSAAQPNFGGVSDAFVVKIGEGSASPCGKIAFISNRDGNNEIYVMDADGSNVTNLTNNLANDAAPSFSPDGSKIAFSSDRDGNLEIYVMDADGSIRHGSLIIPPPKIGQAGAQTAARLYFIPIETVTLRFMSWTPMVRTRLD